MRNNRTLTNEATPPPDNDENMGGPNNEDRAQCALAGLLGFIDACATDDQDAVADLLCNLMHLCDRMPKTYGAFDDAMRRALSNYEAEITPAN